MLNFTKWAGIILFLSWTFYVQAQTIPCANDSIWGNKPDYEIKKKGFIDNIEKWRNEHHTEGRLIEGTGIPYKVFSPGCVETRYVIPVVFHIDVTSGYINVTDSQVKHQLDILNKAFADDSLDIQFVLAKIKPDGTPFSGITTFSLPGLDNRIDFQATMLKNQVHYDPSRYVNIYVVKEILSNSGTPLANGYASPPEQTNTQLITIAYKRLGNPNTCVGCDSLSSVSRGFTLVHEMGHYLGLRHTFEGGCTGGINASSCKIEGDFCCDTRPTTQSVSCPPLGTNSCPTYSPDILQNDSNYVSYNTDDCRNNYTKDQMKLMHATIEQYRSLLADPVNVKSLEPVHCLTSAWFSASENFICDTGYVIFHAYDYTGGTVKYRWQIANSATLAIIKDTISTKDSFDYHFKTAGKYNVILQLIYGNKNDTLEVTRHNMIEVKNCGANIASENANWVFGDHAAIRFTTNGASRNILPWRNNPDNIDAWENSISMSDTMGNLLFYGAGDYDDRMNGLPSTRLFNKEYRPMPNSPVIGDMSASQGLIAARMKNYSHRHYLISACGQEMINSDSGDVRGLRYSVVNPFLDGLKGDVQTDRKNVPVKVPSISGLPYNIIDSAFFSSEFVTLLNKCNNADYWLITTVGDTAFFSTNRNQHTFKMVVFSVTSQGISHHYTSDIKASMDAGGQLKVSPNGLYIAFPGGIANFDRKTGVPTLIKYISNFDNSSGMSFSPDSKFLYAVEYGSGDDSIAQYDLLSSELNRTVIANGKNFLQLQLAPDNKIYATTESPNYLSVINKPDSLPSKFISNRNEFQKEGVYLNSNGIGGTSVMNLPNMVDAKFLDKLPRKIIVRIKNCDSVFFNCTDKCTNNHFWDFGDGNTSTEATPKHLYASAGIYQVIYTNDNGTDTVQVKLIQDNPNFDGDTLICDTVNFQTYTIESPRPEVEYTWSITGTGNSLTVNPFSPQVLVKWKSTGSLTLTATNKQTGCVSSLQKNFTINPITNNLVSGSQYLCPNVSAVIFTGTTPQNVDTTTITYQWEKNTNGTWTTISGANFKNYKPDSSMAEYRRKITKGICANHSNVVKITNGITANTITAANRLFINKSYPMDIYSSTATGDSTTFTYQWQYSLNNSSWTDFTGATNKNFNGILNYDSLYVRRKIMATGCSTNSNVVKVYSNIRIKFQTEVAQMCFTTTDTVYFELGLHNAYHNVPVRVQGYFYDYDLGYEIWRDLYTGIAMQQGDSNYFAAYVPFSAAGLLAPSGKFRFVIELYDGLYTGSEVITYLDCGFRGYPEILRLDTVINEGAAAMFVVKPTCGNISSNPLELYDEDDNLLASSNSDTLIFSNFLRCMNNKDFYITRELKCGYPFIPLATFTMRITTTINYDLWAKDAPADIGNEPSTNMFIWNSNDIWVRKIADNGTTHEAVNYNPSQPHTVYVRIRNRGTQTSIPQKLHLYWTYGATLEEWPKRWTENSQNYFTSCTPPYPQKTYGAEITNPYSPITIPPINPGGSVILSGQWSPEDPKWFCYDSNGVDIINEHEASVCFLARIVECNSDSFGMNRQEVEAVKQNIIWNNNIITKNFSVFQLRKSKQQTGYVWTGVGKQSGTTAPIALRFVSTQPTDFYSQGNVFIYMDNNLRSAWLAGGSVGKRIPDTFRRKVTGNWKWRSYFRKHYIKRWGFL